MRGNSFNITLIATDNHGDYTEQTFSITIQNKNNYPVLLDSPGNLYTQAQTIVILQRFMIVI